MRRSSSDITLSRSIYPQIFADPESMARVVANSATRSSTPPRLSTTAVQIPLANTTSDESFASLESAVLNEFQPIPTTELKRTSSAGSLREGNASPTLHVIKRSSMDVGEYEARQRSPSTCSVTGSPRALPERISVVSYDEESGATVTLNHEENTVDVQLECPPVLKLSPAHRSSEGGDDRCSAEPAMPCTFDLG